MKLYYKLILFEISAQTITQKCKSWGQKGARLGNLFFNKKGASLDKKGAKLGKKRCKFELSNFQLKNV